MKNKIKKRNWRTKKKREVPGMVVTPLSPALWRQRQAALCAFEDSLVHRVNSRSYRGRSYLKQSKAKQAKKQINMLEEQTCNFIFVFGAVASRKAEERIKTSLCPPASTSELLVKGLPQPHPCWVCVCVAMGMTPKTSYMLGQSLWTEELPRLYYSSQFFNTHHDFKYKISIQWCFMRNNYFDLWALFRTYPSSRILTHLQIIWT